MSMLHFFPSLRPPIANRIWFDINVPVNEEVEILRYEREHRAWLDSIKNAASDLNPLGKVLTTIPGPETDDEEANDDSDDSDSHDDEDDDTNDRAIPGQPERERSRSALGLYSPGEEINLNDEIIAAMTGTLTQ